MAKQASPIQLNLVSALGGAILMVGLLGLSSAQTPDEDKTGTVDAAMVEALKALSEAQARQATAWETLAEKGWPTPQNNTFTGNVPRSLSVTLTGELATYLSGTVDSRLSGTVYTNK